MGATFGSIIVGPTWDRKELAELWGYESFHAFGRSVFTPKDDNKIVLFVKEEKREEDVQYEDQLVGTLLRWHGENGHRSNYRVAHAHENGDEIHVFYRKTHRDLFRYFGRAKAKSAEILTGEPSRFVLQLLDWPTTDAPTQTRR